MDTCERCKFPFDRNQVQVMWQSKLYHIGCYEAVIEEKETKDESSVN